MDLLKALLAATKSSDQVVLLANILVCLIGFIWVISSKNQAQDMDRWKTWSFLWASMTGYYLLSLIQWPNAAWWVPFLLLDFSVFILFVGALKDLKMSGRRYLYITIFIVVLARILDVIQVYRDPTSLAYLHQTLAGISLLVWSWIHRTESPSNSLILLVYALIQLPFKQILGLSSIELNISSNQYVQMTFLAYFLGKFALIPATMSVIKAKND